MHSIVTTTLAQFERSTQSVHVTNIAKEVRLLEERIKITEDIICGRLCQNKLREMFNEMDDTSTCFPATFY